MAHLDYKVEVWRRAHLSDEVDVEEIKKRLEAGETASEIENDLASNDQIDYGRESYLFDTEYPLSAKENGGDATEELYSDDAAPAIFTNAIEKKEEEKKDELVLDTDGQWNLQTILQHVMEEERTYFESAPHEDSVYLKALQMMVRLVDYIDIDRHTAKALLTMEHPGVMVMCKEYAQHEEGWQGDHEPDKEVEGDLYTGMCKQDLDDNEGELDEEWQTFKVWAI